MGADSPPTIDNPAGGYAFLPGIDAYSSGAAAAEGFEIVHATLHTPLRWRAGLLAIADYLEAEGRPPNALCGIELRSPAAVGFDDFARFNRGYHRVVRKMGLLVDDRNPVARTNVAPVHSPPDAVVVHAFSFTRQTSDAPHTWVTAGAGELLEDHRSGRAVVRAGERSPDAMAEKARHVLRTMTDRIEALGGSWTGASTVDVYMTGDPSHVTRVAIAPLLGATIARGIHWYPSSPPIDVLDFEMDVRGVVKEIGVDLG